MGHGPHLTKLVVICVVRMLFVLFCVLFVCKCVLPPGGYQLQSTNMSFYSNIHPTRCNVKQFILSGNCSTCFGWYLHPSSGGQTNIYMYSIWYLSHRYCYLPLSVGTGLSVLWVAYATHSTLKQLPTLPR
jgi:hypothetical protein